MKKLLFLCLGLLAVCHASAELQHSTSADGTVTLTLKATGDLNSGYGSLPDNVKNATKIVVITENGAKMNEDDAKKLFGDWGGVDNFPNVVKLDLENAEMSSDTYLSRLGFMNNLKSLTFPRSTTQIPNSCLINKDNHVIEEIIITGDKNSLIKIGTQAFAASTLKKVVFGASIDEIGTGCFLNCTSLTTVDFHYGTTKIGAQAFYGCTALKNVILPEGLEEIGKGAFEEAGIVSIRLPNTLKYIRTEAFGLCHDLKTITIPASVELIEYQAFQQNYNLSDVYVLGTTTKCANQAFQPVNTYQYTYSGAGEGEQVKRSAYEPIDNQMQTRTVFHYPQDAYEQYVNEDARKLGTSGYNRKYVKGEYGHNWAVSNIGLYDHNTGDYAGWNNFMLIGGVVENQIWMDVKGDKWYTMCVPFPMTREQLESAYGVSVEVVEFSGVEVTPGEGNSKNIKLKFKNPVQETKAHHPYMIHPGLHTGDGKGVQNTIVGIQKEAEEQSKLDVEKVSFDADGVTYTFIGNYDENKKLQPHSYYYYSADDTSVYPNGFYKWGATEGGKWTRYTACVLLSKDNGANVKADAEYASETETPTEIVTFSVDAGAYMEGKVYNVNGLLVRNSMEDAASLPKGIYIVNGKKFVKR